MPVKSIEIFNPTGKPAAGYDLDHTVARASESSACAGIEQPDAIAAFAQCIVCMSKECDLRAKQARLLKQQFCIPLHAEQVSVRHEDPYSAQLSEDTRLCNAGKIAVARNMHDLHIRQRIGKILCIGNVVAQMQDCIRHFSNNCIIHITDGAVRIRKNEKFQINHLCAAMCIE